MDERTRPVTTSKPINEYTDSTHVTYKRMNERTVERAKCMSAKQTEMDQ